MGPLAYKLSAYGAELAYAVKVPPTTRDRAKLVWETLRFHVRNGARSVPDPARRIGVTIRAEGRRFPIVLRPEDGDLAIFYEIFVRDCYRIPEDTVPAASVRTIVDCGGNIGLSALYFAARYPNARIFSVEPNPDNYALLKRNASAEPRITPVQACVTGVGEQQVYIDTVGKGSHFRINSEARGVPVRGMSLDQIREAYGIGQIDLLKMDIEGAEKQVLAHPAFLAQTGAIVAELHPGYELADFARDVAPYGLEARPSPWAKEPGIFIATKTQLNER